MKFPTRTLAVMAITTTAILWGFSFISIKVAVTVMQPMTLALSRFALAAVLLLVVLKLVEPKTRLKLRDYPIMALAGFIGVTAYFFFENNGVKLTTASMASIIVATTPVLTLVAEALLYKSRLTRFKILMVLVSLLGVYFVVGADYHQLTTSGQGRGFLLMMGAVVSWVAYCLFTKDLGHKYSQLAITCYQSLFGTVTILPFALLETNNWQLINGTVLINVAFLGIFCSAIGYYLYIFAMHHLGVGVTSLFINLIPVVTVIASYFILGETITLPQICGGLLVLGSVYLLTWPGRGEGEPASQPSHSA